MNKGGDTEAVKRQLEMMNQQYDTSIATDTNRTSEQETYRQGGDYGKCVISKKFKGHKMYADSTDSADLNVKNDLAYAGY